jgi:chaperonin cofactor prefoldin
MHSSTNPNDIASYGELLEELHRHQKMTANLAQFQDIVYELATVHQRQGDICLGCPSSMTATDGIIYRKYSECSVAICIEKHKITSNLMTRHDMGVQITRLTNKINKLEEQLKNIEKE